MSSTPRFHRTDSFGKSSKPPAPKNSSASHKRLSNKENLFLQVAQKQSLVVRRIDFNQPKQGQISENEEINHLREKVIQLDSENVKLRELLTKLQYHQVRRAELNTSTHSDRHDRHDMSFSDKKNDSIDFTTDDQHDVQMIVQSKSMLSLKQFCNQNHSAQEKKFKSKKCALASIAAQKVVQVRNTRNLAQKYFIEQLQEESFDLNQSSFVEQQQPQDCVYKTSCEFYKHVLMQLIKKDAKIFENIDYTLQTELDKQYKENMDNYMHHQHILQSLLDTIELIASGFRGECPQADIITNIIKEQNKLIANQQGVIENLKKILITNLSINNKDNENQELLLQQSEIAVDTIKQAGSESQQLMKLVDQRKRLKCPEYVPIKLIAKQKYSEKYNGDLVNQSFDKLSEAIAIMRNRYSRLKQKAGNILLHIHSKLPFIKTIPAHELTLNELHEHILEQISFLVNN